MFDLLIAINKLSNEALDHAEAILAESEAILKAMGGDNAEGS